MCLLQKLLKTIVLEVKVNRITIVQYRWDIIGLDNPNISLKGTLNYLFHNILYIIRIKSITCWNVCRCTFSCYYSKRNGTNVIITNTLCPATSIHLFEDTGKELFSKSSVEIDCNISFDFGPWSDSIPYSLEQSVSCTSLSEPPWDFDKSWMLCWIWAKLWYAAPPAAAM